MIVFQNKVVKEFFFLNPLNFFYFFKFLKLLKHFFFFYFIIFSHFKTNKLSKLIFVNFRFLNFFQIKNNFKNYLFYYIYFKKKNSLLKKKYNYLKNINPIRFRHKFRRRRKVKFTFRFRKKILKRMKNKVKQKKSSNFNRLLVKTLDYLKFFKKRKTKYSHPFLRCNKKIKKTLSINRVFYDFLNYNEFNKFKTRKKDIYLKTQRNINYILLDFEFNIINILLNSSLIRSYQDAKFLVKKKLIYVNRTLLGNFKYTTKLNDIIELIYSLKFFHYFHYFKKIVKKKMFKFRIRIWFRVRYKRQKLEYFRKNIYLNRLFKSITFFRFKFFNYYEIDFFSFTLFIIKKDLNLFNINIILKKLLVVYLFRLYN